MANVYANAGGDWSDNDIWDSPLGTLYGVPRNGDTVFLNGATINLDCVTAQLAAIYPGTTENNSGSGAIIVENTTDARTISANILQAGTTTLITSNMGSPNLLTITGNIYGGLGGIGIRNSSTGAINITGNITGGAAITSYGVLMDNGTLTVYGSVIASGNSEGVSLSGSSSISLGNTEAIFWTIINSNQFKAITTDDFTINDYNPKNYIQFGSYKFPALLAPADVQKGAYNGDLVGTLPVTFVESNNVNCGTSMSVSF